MAQTVGRRVESVSAIERPGDYCGPVRGYTGEVEACFFLLPIADPENPLWRGDEGSGLHHVAFPPHTYRECGDGSIEIRASIGAYGNSDRVARGGPYIWHGYLDCGHVWREA